MSAPRLQVISCNHKHVATPDRILLGIDDARWKKLKQYLIEECNVAGVVYVNTCNRVELYYESREDLRFIILAKWFEIADHVVAKDRIKTYFGTRASVRYMMDVSMGLESAILGDDQILRQIKLAFERARSEGTLSTLLERSYQTIMKCHKEVSRETDYRKQTISLAYHALNSIKNHLGKEALKQQKVLILGAGEMAGQVTKYLDKFTFAHVTLSNRTHSKAESLANGKNISVVPYESINVRDYNVIVSTTDQGHALVKDWEGLNYYVDLSIASSGLSSVDCPHIYLEKLQDYINKHQANRLRCVGRVKRFMSNHEEEFMTWAYAWQLRKEAKSKGLLTETV